MANSRGPTSVRHMYNGGNYLLPPKSPFPSIPSSYANFIPSSVLGQKGVPNHREGNPHHQRTTSESFLMEEQPSWLDDLLNEPDIPVRKGGHRRSSSDSFAYVDSMNVVSLDSIAKDESRAKAHPSWHLPDYDLFKDVHHVSHYSDPKSSLKDRNRAWDPYLNSAVNPRSLPSPRDKTVASSKSSAKPLEAEIPPFAPKKEAVDAGAREPKGSSERKDPSEAMPAASETDTKRSKQQFAQRSRVRKLQYIAELERSVQAVQAEGSDISAQLEFLGQRHLILSMENKALKQRLENLSHEQLIKRLEHEVLERERGRLRALYQQQKAQIQPQPKTSGPRRSSSGDLDQQLANLSLKPKDASPGRDPVSDQL